VEYEGGATSIGEDRLRYLSLPKQSEGETGSATKGPGEGEGDIGGEGRLCHHTEQ
jgi:hypothetical protein